jgi:hypothetical protein
MDAVEVVRGQSRQRKVSTNPARNRGIPRKKSGPAQRAIPTTISENPSKTTVSLPAQAINQKIRRNGRDTINQIPANAATNICPKDQTLDSCSSRVLALNGLSARRRWRSGVRSPVHQELAEWYRLVSDWACFILASG